jgi:hypothetical protein
VGNCGHGERWFPCPGLPPFYCCAAREGTHCHTRQAPPIRARIGSVSRSGDHFPNIIMLNTDQHNVRVKKKMTEEDFIRNNRRINGGNDLPREFLSELYFSICRNEIRTIPEQVAGCSEMSFSRWVDLMWKSKRTTKYIACDSYPFLDHDMFFCHGWINSCCYFCGL